MKRRITQQDIRRVDKGLAEARVQKNLKRIIFLESTLAIYKKAVKA